MYTIKLKSSTKSMVVKHVARNITLKHSGRTGLQGDPGVGIAAGGTNGQILRKASNDDYDTEWATASGTGDMLASTYDPQNIADDSFDRANHTGTQAISSVTGLQGAIDAKANTSHNHTASQVTDFDTEVANNTDVAANTTARHTHSNKALLDTYDQTNANIADAVTKKHSHANQTVLDNTTASFLTADETKLDGIATGATANDTDANLKNRANHTGAQAISTVTNLQSSLDAKAIDADVVHDTGNETVGGIKTFSSDPLIPDEVYDATAWNGSLEPPTKNAVRDKIESLVDEGTIDTIVAGNNIDVDATDPANPIVSVEDLTSADVGLNNVNNTSDANKPVSTAQQTALDAKVDENAGITGATKTKITYDAKGLITAGTDATTADVADSSNKRYVTDAQQTVISNTSGTNTGDQTVPVKATGAETDTGTNDTKFLTPKAIEDSLYAKQAYTDALVVDSVADSDTTHAPSRNAVFDSLALKAPLASPTFTGTVTLPTGLTGVIRADSGVASVDSDVTDIVSAASTTLAGKAELATIAETDTGTDTGRVVTPDGLSGSVYGTKVASIQVIDGATALTTGDGKAYFRIPTALNGMDLISASASVLAKSTSGNPTVMISRGRQANATTAHAFVDMLSTAITIDANDFDSKDAGTPAVINTSNDDVATGDLIRIDVDVAGTAATGLFVTLQFRVP